MTKCKKEQCALTARKAGWCKNHYKQHLFKTNPEALRVHQASQRRYYERNREKHASSQIRTRYGITMEERESMRSQQGGVCKICHEKRRLVVEHCHVTNKVRGLTCDRCNQFIAYVERNPGLYAKVISYLCGDQIEHPDHGMTFRAPILCDKSA